MNMGKFFVLLRKTKLTRQQKDAMVKKLRYHVHNGRSEKRDNNACKNK